MCGVRAGLKGRGVRKVCGVSRLCVLCARAVCLMDPGWRVLCPGCVIPVSCLVCPVLSEEGRWIWGLKLLARLRWRCTHHVGCLIVTGGPGGVVGCLRPSYKYYSRGREISQEGISPLRQIFSTDRHHTHVVWLVGTEWLVGGRRKGREKGGRREGEGREKGGRREGEGREKGGRRYVALDGWLVSTGWLVVGRGPRAGEGRGPRDEGRAEGRARAA